MSAATIRASAKTRRLLAWLFGLTWLAAFAATHAPPGEGPGMGISDKVLHFAGYAVLAGPLIWLLAARGASRRRRVAMTLGILLAYAAADELTQPIAGRDADVLDWVCDAAGTATAVTLWETVFAAWRRRRRAKDTRRADSAETRQ